jgi:hypothetical protein
MTALVFTITAARQTRAFKRHRRDAMSVLDEMAALEAKIAARIRELAPLAAEHERLRQYADKLGLDLSTDAKPTSPRRRSRSTSRKRTTTRKSSAGTPKRASGRAVKATGNGAPSRTDQLAELVRRKPGLTVREVAEQLGVKDPTGLYRPIRKLEQAGELRRSKGKLEPVG